jgi:hypothetical protein
MKVVTGLVFLRSADSRLMTSRFWQTAVRRSRQTVDFRFASAWGGGAIGLGLHEEGASRRHWAREGQVVPPGVSVTY